MTTKELFENLKSDFGLIPIAHYSQIRQNGDYATLSGFDRVDLNTKEVSVKVLFVRNTLEREVYKFMDEIAEFEDKILKMEAKFRGIILKSMQIQAISEEKFAYVLNLDIPIKRVE